MNVSLLQAIPAELRADAETFRRYGQDASAKFLSAVADRFDRGIEQWLNEALDLQVATAESRHSYDTLQRKLRDGSLPNAGEKGRPKILRRHLPLKGGTDGAHLVEDGPDLAAEVLARRLS